VSGDCLEPISYTTTTTTTAKNKSNQIKSMQYEVEEFNALSTKNNQQMTNRTQPT
jgi:hypothetical protein